MTTTLPPTETYDPTICPALLRGEPHGPHAYRYSMDGRLNRQDCPGLPRTSAP